MLQQGAMCEMTRALLGAVVVLVAVCMALLVVNVRRANRVPATPRATYHRRATGLDDRHILTSSASEGHIDQMLLPCKNSGQLEELEMSAFASNASLCESTP